MRIAILGSVTTKIPPTGQAAIEKLAYQQAMGLADRGHSILLFALKGSQIAHSNIRLVEVGSGEARSGAGNEKQSDESIYGVSYKLRLEIVNLAQVLAELDRLSNDYDIVLNNLRGEAILLPLLAKLQKPLYHVLHLPIFPELADLFKKYQTRLISISDAQRQSFPDLNYVATVYNGVDTSEFAFNQRAENYVLYLGSIGSNKNPKDAILAAKKAGVTLKIGGRIKDREYFDKEIVHHLDGQQVVWVGELNHPEIIKIYQNAQAFLFPTLWQEPFGLVAIEAMSCGTPVIAYPNGALPEIVEDGVNGYLVNSIDQMADKIKQIDQIDRSVCRKSVESKFSIEKMIDGYEKVLLKTI